VIIAQAAHTILDVGLLHKDAPPVLFACLGLVSKAPGDVFAFAAAHAFVFEMLLELDQEIPVAAEIAGLEQRSFGDHVAVGLLDGLRNRARGVSNLVTDVPESRESLTDNFLGGLRGLRLRYHEHDVDVAERCQLPAAITAESRYHKGLGEAFWNH
jgi:hypothetical protein